MANAGDTRLATVPCSCGHVMTWTQTFDGSTWTPSVSPVHTCVRPLTAEERLVREQGYLRLYEGLSQSNLDLLKSSGGFIVYIYVGDVPSDKHPGNKAVNVSSFEEARQAVKDTKKYIVWSSVDIYGPVSIRVGTIVPLPRDGVDQIVCKIDIRWLGLARDDDVGVEALVDTGASHTIVYVPNTEETKDFWGTVKTFKLEEKDTDVGGTKFKLFRVPAAIVLGNDTLRVAQVYVTSQCMPSKSYSAILGMDALKVCTFTISAMVATLAAVEQSARDVQGAAVGLDEEVRGRPRRQVGGDGWDAVSDGT